MENKDKPAFPGLNKDGYATGITKYEYFLAHAPETIPEWFRHSMEEFGERPKFMDYPNDYFWAKQRDYPIFKKYNFQDKEWNFEPGDPTSLEAFKLAESEIKEYTAKFLDSQKKRNEWDERNKVERYFQWRQFWAMTICGL